METGEPALTGSRPSDIISSGQKKKPAYPRDFSGSPSLHVRVREGIFRGHAGDEMPWERVRAVWSRKRGFMCKF